MAHLLVIESFLGGNAVLLPTLMKQMGHTYTFVTRNRTIYQSAYHSREHVVLRHADVLIETDTNDVSTLLKDLPDRRYDGVITTCDYYIETVAEVSEKRGIPCPFPKNVEVVRHKQKLRQALDQAKLPNPKYAVAHVWDEVRRAAEDIGYPLVLKPVDLSSSAYVRLIKDEKDLQEAFQLLEAFPKNWRDQKRDCTYLLEEYMVGDEVSVEAIAFHGETTVVGITQKALTGAPYFIEEGHLFPANLPKEEAIEISDYVKEALRAVKYDYGISHTEVKLTSAGPRIVEINPRAAGDHIVEIVEIVCGANILKAFVDLSLGRKPTITNQHKDICSACVMFLIPPKGGKILSMEGVETLKSNSNVLFHEFEDCVGKTVGPPIDNASRIGRIITKDAEGYHAMEYAKEALQGIALNLE